MSRTLGWLMLLPLVIAACGRDEEPAAGEQDAVTVQPPMPRPASAEPTVAAEPEAEAPTAVPATPQVEAPPSAYGRLYTVQIAAYEVADSASSLARRLERRGLPVWTSEVEVSGMRYHRVRIGALPDLAETRSLGERIAHEFSARTWVAPVEEARGVPAGTVEATRAFAQESA